MNQITLIPIKEIAASGQNPRRTFDNASIIDLAEDIKDNGLMQPVTVRKLSAPRNDYQYELIAGERRLRACKLTDMEVIPAIVNEVSLEKAFQMQISENIHRKDMNPMEEARAFSQLLSEGPKNTVAEVAALVHKSESYVRKRLELVNLIPEISIYVIEGVVPLRHGYRIAALADKDQKRVLKNMLTIHEEVPYWGSMADLNRVINSLSTNLEAALFDPRDVNIYPQAGDCMACPKRAANTLFGDDPGLGDARCLDRHCFEEKSQRYTTRLIKSLENKFPMAKEHLVRTNDISKMSTQVTYMSATFEEEDGFFKDPEKVCPDCNCRAVAIISEGNIINEYAECRDWHLCPANHRNDKQQEEEKREARHIIEVARGSMSALVHQGPASNGSERDLDRHAENCRYILNSNSHVITEEKLLLMVMITLYQEFFPGLDPQAYSSITAGFDFQANLHSETLAQELTDQATEEQAIEMIRRLTALMALEMYETENIASKVAAIKKEKEKKQ